MKIRNGFISNSSSSSFIIHKSRLTKEKWKELGTFLYDLEQEKGEPMWGDSSNTFYEENDYLYIEASRVWSEVTDKFKELDFDYQKEALLIEE
jgi:hypothetical protein